jgi:MYXO-CTERM domain-containing protein
MARRRLCALVLFAVALTSSGFAAPVVFSSGEDQVFEWQQSPDAVTLSGTGFLGNRFVRLEAGGSVATLITDTALTNAVYGMTAALARFSSQTTWALEVFAGGEVTLGFGTPAGSTLLISAGGGVPAVSTEDAPLWLAQGTGHSDPSHAIAAGTLIWGRVRAIGGPLGVDSVLGVENVNTVWFPGENPSKLGITNWNFENDPRQTSTPEPTTAMLALAGLSLLAVARWRRRS